MFSSHVEVIVHIEQQEPYTHIHICVFFVCVCVRIYHSKKQSSWSNWLNLKAHLYVKSNKKMKMKRFCVGVFKKTYKSNARISIVSEGVSFSLSRSHTVVCICSCVFELCIRTMPSILLPFVLRFLFCYVLPFPPQYICSCNNRVLLLLLLLLFLLLFLATIWDPDVFCRLCLCINETYMFVRDDHDHWTCAHISDMQW